MPPRRAGRSVPPAGRMAPRQFEGEYASAELFPQPLVNSAVQPLQPAEWTGPLPYTGGDMAFLRLDGVLDAGISLYDAQLSIEQELHEAQFREKMEQMIEKLKRRSSLTDQSEMSRRLFEIAAAAPAQREPARICADWEYEPSLGKTIDQAIGDQVLERMSHRVPTNAVLLTQLCLCR